MEEWNGDWEKIPADEWIQVNSVELQYKGLSQLIHKASNGIRTIQQITYSVKMENGDVVYVTNEKISTYIPTAISPQEAYPYLP